MTQEYIETRENEFFDFLNTYGPADPSTRGTEATESFTATAGQTVFNLASTTVKYVRGITNDGVFLRRGYDYKVDYPGLINPSLTTPRITLTTGAVINKVVAIKYHQGDNWFDMEYSRDSDIMPRVVMMFLTASQEYAGLGDLGQDGNAQFINATYQFEIRSLSAEQAKYITNRLFDMCNQVRQAILYKTNACIATDMTQINFDPDTNAYTWQFTVYIQWEVGFDKVTLTSY